MRKNNESKGPKADRRDFLGSVAKGMGAAVLGSRIARAAPVRAAPVRKEARGRYLSASPLSRVGFVIHGGAGTITRGSLTPELEKLYRDELSRALSTGYDILKNGGSGLDAVVAALRIMEDSPIFNAGKGAVFTSAGTNELDASIMDGGSLKAGSVAVLKHVKNPISLARLVMEKSPHVMMVGEGAEAFAKQQGVQLVPQSYFYTERRWKELQKMKADEQKGPAASEKPGRNRTQFTAPVEKHGTVGAAALDQSGNLTSGTSTGGIPNKKFGRVGDSPIIGAGTYANNLTCAISGTGDGEYFIRSVFAHDISALMQYSGKSLREAAEVVIKKVGALGGTGGMIGIDREGNIAQVFNTEGMYRGRVEPDGKLVIEIYKE